MDVNWYTAEIMVRETLHAQRTRAEVARLAAIARQYRTPRGIGAVLIKLGRTLVGEASAARLRLRPRVDRTPDPGVVPKLGC